MPAHQSHIRIISGLIFYYQEYKEILLERYLKCRRSIVIFYKVYTMKKKESALSQLLFWWIFIVFIFWWNIISFIKSTFPSIVTWQSNSWSLALILFFVFLGPILLTIIISRFRNYMSRTQSKQEMLPNSNSMQNSSDDWSFNNSSLSWNYETGKVKTVTWELVNPMSIDWL